MWGAHLEGADVRSILPLTSKATTIGIGPPLITDLSKVQSLTQAQLDTMYGDSLTSIPKHLTRPEHWPDVYTIEHDTNLETEPVRAQPFVFLSYATEDREWIADLRNSLQAEGINIWWDQDILLGQDWRTEIDKHLEASHAVLTCWSEQSVSSKSVAEEASNAQSTNKLVHVRFSDIKLPFGFAGTQHLDLFSTDRFNQSTNWKRLISALRFHLDPPDTEEAAKIFSHDSPVEGEVRQGGKLGFADRPKGVDPIAPDPEDLEQRVSTQIENINDIVDDLSEARINWNTGPLIKSLSRYKAMLQRVPLSWHAPNDRILRIQSVLKDEDLCAALDSYLLDGINLIITRHYDMAPRLRPVQLPPDPDDEIPPAPPVSVTPDDDDELRDAAQNVAAEIRRGIDAGIIDSDIGDSFNELAEDFDEIAEMPAVTDEQRDKKASALRRTVTSSALYLGTVFTTITATVIANALSDPVAATRLYEMLKPWFEFFLRFF